MKIITILGFSCMLYVSAYSQALRNIPKSEVLVAAHRGDWHYTPENSLEGIKLAMKSGARILETDVRLTADDSLVLMHDYTLDRTTTGKGRVEELPYSYISQVYLRNGQGSPTKYRVPLLSTALDVVKDKMYIYFDKAHYDPKGKSKGYTIKKILGLLRAKNMLSQGIFVLSYTYDEAKAIFGEDLERVNYIPVIEDKIPNLEQYVNQYLSLLKPVAFQFRIASLDNKAYQLLPHIKKSDARCFIAATWEHHTAGHDDIRSIMESPDAGWGWLIREGFDIIETNYYENLLYYLRNLNSFQSK